MQADPETLDKLEPTIVWTSLIGLVYIEAYEMFGMERHREILKSVTRWILGVPREATRNGICLQLLRLWTEFGP